MSENSIPHLLISYREITDKLTMNEGALTPELEQSLQDIDIRMPLAVDHTSYTIERLEHEEEYFKKKAESYTKIARGLSNARQRMRDSLKFLMEQSGQNELIGIDVRFKLSNSRPKLVINEEVLDPQYYLKVITQEPDKKRIEETLKNGEEVEGATFIESKSLRIYPNTKGNKDGK